MTNEYGINRESGCLAISVAGDQVWREVEVSGLLYDYATPAEIVEYEERYRALAEAADLDDCATNLDFDRASQQARYQRAGEKKMKNKMEVGDAWTIVDANPAAMRDAGYDGSETFTLRHDGYTSENRKLTVVGIRNAVKRIADAAGMTLGEYREQCARGRSVLTVIVHRA